jgi:hypothetical protein
MQPAKLQGRTSGNQPRVAVVLALATVAFGVSAVYLARSLNVERARRAHSQGSAIAEAAQPSLPPAGPASSVPATAATAADGRSQGAPQDTPAASSEDAAPLPGARPNPALETRAIKTIEELGDPARRAQKVAAIRERYAPHIEQLISEAGLQRAEAERVLDFMAETEVNNELGIAECQLKPGCDLRGRARMQAGSELEQLARTISHDGMQRFLDFEARQRVRAFASNLPEEMALTEEHVDHLTAAFMSGRQRWMHTQDPIEAIDMELRDAAAAILSREQLAAFASGQRRFFDFN